MEAWNEGYMTGINYINGYCREVNPLLASLPFLNTNIDQKEIKNVCELGFGNGISVAIHAATQVGVSYWGTDFNPSQTAFANSLVKAAGVNCFLFDQSFEEFCSRTDLPQFDFIALHGIWSWVSEANRQIIVQFLRDRLAVGGIVYISYNALPGWSAAAPMRQIFSQYSETLVPPSKKMVSKVGDAIAFFDEMMKLEPAYAVVTPSLSATFDYVKEQDKSYLAHEYFNHHWTPMYFANLAESLASTKLEFACSATLLEHVEVINLSVEQSRFISDIADPLFRETVRDMFVNQKFRKDYWIRGKQELSKAQRNQQILDKEFVLVVPRKSIDLSVTGIKGKLPLNEAIYNPVLDIMAEHGIISVREIVEPLVPKLLLTTDQVMQVLMILVAKGYLSAVQPRDRIAASLNTSHQLNRHLIELALCGKSIQFLASPVTGGAVNTTNIEQMFLHSVLNERSTKEQMVDDVWKILLATGTRINFNNNSQLSEAENRLGLEKYADLFIEQKLPIYRALQVI